ncbi:MAG: amino acid adenylation domain-containing protein, partial [Polyangiaceae bacterium]|nr:amino acid adenylation domain-containing protein [Polyangiaceae bacterium]
MNADASHESDSDAFALPMSFAQERLWFLDQLSPGGAVYNIPLAMRIRAPLAASALERALAELVRRHEALRTTFGMEGGRAVQVIGPARGVALRRVELSGPTPAAREAEAGRLAAEEAARPFDLSRGPLLRATLLVIGPADHLLLLTMHHSVSDGWSVKVLMSELGALYDAFVAGRPSPLPELPIQYADYACWQREQLEGERLSELVGYWERALAGAPTLLTLPSDRPRPAAQTYRGALQPFHVPRAEVSALRALAQEQRATLFMAMTAAFGVLLGRHAGVKDVLIGAPVANRTRREVEGLIGFFVNTLALRVDQRGEPTFRELLGRVREATLGAYAHQELPFERLVEHLQPERGLGHGPLVQVMISLEAGSGPMASSGGEEAGPAGGMPEPTPGTSKLDLTLFLSEAADGLRGAFEYSTDLFDAATIQRLCNRFLRLLRAVAEAPDRPCSILPVVPDEELRQIAAWNATGAEGAAACVHHVIAAQAARTPGRIAVSCEGNELTYGQLWPRVEEVARYLVSRGVGRGALVGLCVDRSFEMVVGLLGVLRAGAAYVPLDPGYPKERLAFMVRDAEAAVLLTQHHLLEALPETSAERVCLDRDRDRIAAARGDLPAEVEPDDVAYVIYTSGSTGLPKGVMIQQRALFNHMAWMQDRFGLGERDRLLHKTPFSFDVAMFELIWPLMAGARLVMARPGGHRDSAYLVETIQREQVTVTYFVASMLQAFLEQPGSGACRSLRHVFCGGEALPRAAVERWCAALPWARLHNIYGPTETTIDVTWWTCDAGRRTVPIGWPIRNTQIHILDERLQPVPIGVTGELYVGGASLGIGYLRRPGLTADRFIPDPRPERPGARLYRSGDLARWAADGVIEFLGRTDHQVKLRGQRIELGEIEQALSQHPAVREAAAAVREDGAAGRRLFAWFVPAGEAPPAAELRAFCLDRLTEAMVPSRFIAVDALPRTPNGKVDRDALPAPGVAGGAAPRAAPRTPVEERLASIFAELLGVPEIGVDQGFFELGGHSLLAVQLVSRARAAFDIELPLRSVFETPTVAALAEIVAARAARPRTGDAIVPRGGGAPGARPMSFAQERLWFLDQLSPGSAVYNVPLAMRLGAPIDARALERALTEIVRRHEALRTTFIREGGGGAQVIGPARAAPLRRVDLSRSLPAAREAEAARLAAEEAAAPFDLARGPLMRSALIRLGPADHVLLLTLHHIVFDGWSTGVLTRELGALYDAFVAGRPSPLPELPIQYADYARWQRDRLQGDRLSELVGYWERALAGAPTLLTLPSDRPRPAVQSHRGALQVFQVPRAETSAMRALAQEQRATLFMAATAAFGVLLGRRAGVEDLLIGAPVANRTRAEVEGLIGLFVNTLALRVDLRGAPSFLEVLGRVREVTLGAYAHQDLPFERLVEHLTPQRGLGHGPLVQVMISLQAAPRGARTAGAARAGAEAGRDAGMPAPTPGTSKLDLTLFLVETGEGLEGAFEYSTDLFDAATIQAMSRGFVELLRAAAAAPGAPISELGAGAAGGPPQWAPAGAEARARHEMAGGALPAPAGERGPGPRTEVEGRLARLVADLLGLEEVGVDQGVFELGGHSLLASQLVSRVRGAFGVELPLRSVFETPTVAELAGVITALLRGGRAQDEAPPPAAPAAPRPAAPEPAQGAAPADQAPLSFAQQRLWFLEQLQPGRATYNVAATSRLRSPVDAAVLERSLGEIVRRHAVLRTTFGMAGGAPVQIVAPRGAVPVSVVDLRGAPPEQRVDRALRLAAEASRRPFDLARGPLLRCALYRLDAADHLLVVIVHHIVSDDWSMGLLFRELAALYDAFAADRPSPLPELPIRYADFARRERAELAGEGLERRLAYWREKLAGAPALLDLPPDRPRPAEQSARGATHSFSLSPGLTGRLKALGRREGATLFMTLLAGFNALLHRYTRQADIVVGAPVSNRGRAELEGLIGFFLNTVVLRTDLSGDPSFRALLARARETTLEAFAHQDLPFERLVEALRPERSLGHPPLFQAMLALQTSAMPGGSRSHRAGQPAVAVTTGTAKFDLLLTVADGDEVIDGIFEYSTDLFDESTIARLARHFEALLDAAAAEPDRPLSDLPLCAEEERRAVVEWNATAAPWPADRCVHDLFEAQAARSPDAIAVRMGGRALTYRELDARAARLARRLARRGAGPDAPVGLLADRSIELVVAILAILKAGGAYVPLDPGYPRERLELMLRDAGARVLLARGALADKLRDCDADIEFIEPDIRGPGSRSTRRALRPEPPLDDADAVESDDGALTLAEALRDPEQL